MGPVNWLAVIIAPILAIMIAIVWYGPIFRFIHPFVQGKPKARGDAWLGGVLMLIGSTMLGHNFARIGAETMAAKPWLYFMQSGGIAIAFVIPAIWMTYYRMGADRRTRLVESGYYLVAYLAMGAVFWALA